MKKTLYTVTVKTSCDSTFTFADSDTETLGSQAYSQYYGDIEVSYDDGKVVFIPFHAICSVEITKTAKEVEYEDNNCKE